jgi:hypothetical protein
MNHAKSMLLAKAAALVFACGTYGVASAKIVEGVSLGAWDVVNQFNSMNYGQGLLFSHAQKGGIYYQIFPTGQLPDLSAYPKDPRLSQRYFMTMKAARGITINAYDAYVAAGKLHYDGSTTKAYDPTVAYPTTLSVGAAFIYTNFIQGSYGGPFMNYSSSTYPYHTDRYGKTDMVKGKQFYDAWSILTNQDRIRLGTSSNLGLSLWGSSQSNNYILQSLLSMNNDKSYWLAPYDPDKLYTEIGYYSVFSMNTTRVSTNPLYNVGGPATSMLYLVDMTPTLIPEPETYVMMLAGLGVIGAIARRRRSQTKSVT